MFVSLQLASALEERDRLKNMFNELKREKHAQGGPEVTSGALVQAGVVNVQQHILLWMCN